MSYTNSGTDAEAYSRTASLPDATSMTIACWIRFGTDKTFNTAWALHDGANHLALSTGGDPGEEDDLFIFDDFGTGGGLAVRTNTVAGEWLFSAVVRGGAVANTVNYTRTLAELTLTVGTNASLGAQTESGLYIGRSIYPTTESFRGDLAAFKIWDTPLTEAEAFAESLSMFPVRRTNLNSYYPFWNGGTGVLGVSDFGPSGLTLSGGTGSGTGTQPPVKISPSRWPYIKGVKPVGGGGADVRRHIIPAYLMGAR